MPEKKKIKVKRKKRKLKVKRIIICLLVLISLVLLFLYIKKLPIKNIYIVGNNILSDKEIIEEAGISNYPSFLATSSSTIKKKLLKGFLLGTLTVCVLGMCAGCGQKTENIENTVTSPTAQEQTGKTY